MVNSVNGRRRKCSVNTCMMNVYIILGLGPDRCPRLLDLPSRESTGHPEHFVRICGQSEFLDGHLLGVFGHAAGLALLRLLNNDILG